MTKIIQISNTLKNVIELQDHTFKNCKKLMSSHKEGNINIDKCISPYIFNLPKTHQTPSPSPSGNILFYFGGPK